MYKFLLVIIFFTLNINCRPNRPHPIIPCETILQLNWQGDGHRLLIAARDVFDYIDAINDRLKCSNDNYPNIKSRLELDLKRHKDSIKNHFQNVSKYLTKKITIEEFEKQVRELEWGFKGDWYKERKRKIYENVVNSISNYSIIQ